MGNMDRLGFMFEGRTRAFNKHNIQNNRLAQHHDRKNQRRLLHENARNVGTADPTPDKPAETENKENVPNPRTVRKDKEAKLTRQQVYMQRFMEWRTKQKQQELAKRQKQQPANANNPITRTNSKTQTCTTPQTEQKTRQEIGRSGMRSIYKLRVSPKSQKMTNKQIKTGKNILQPRKLDFKQKIPTITTTTTNTTTKALAQKQPNNLITSQTSAKKVQSLPRVSSKLKAKEPSPAPPSTTTNKLSNLVTTFGSAAKVAKKNVKKNAVPNRKTPTEKICKGQVNGIVEKPPATTNTISGEKKLANLVTSFGNTAKVVKTNVKKNVKPTKLSEKSKVKPVLTKIEKKPKNLKMTQPISDVKGLNTPLDLLFVSGVFAPSLTSTTQRIPSPLFNFDTQLPNSTPKTTITTSNNRPSNSSQYQKWLKYCEDVQFISDDSRRADLDKSTLDSVEDVTLKPATNYVSSFVSISRGKVSAQKERKQRDSMYLNNSVADNSIRELVCQPTDSTEEVEKRRKLEAIRYFRQQVESEIVRLHKFCDEWAAYREANLAELQRLNVDDMIDAAIGQTKLLTSKKFQQFVGLIDRCENAPINDGSEDTKPITVVDLEGFWSMVGLQIENVDKRFVNLTHWKLNNWLDPDAQQQVKPKVKKTTAAVKAKGKSKCSSGIREMMRKKQAELQQQQQQQKVEDEQSLLILTPSHRRHSIIVKDRKSFSNSPTRLLMSGRRRSITPTNKCLESPKLIPHVVEFKNSLSDLELTLKSTGGTDNLLKSALRGAMEAIEQRRSAAVQVVTPAQLKTARKSILKTPGTEKRQYTRQVSFNLSAMLKEIKFVDDSNDFNISE